MLVIIKLVITGYAVIVYHFSNLPVDMILQIRIVNNKLVIKSRAIALYTLLKAAVLYDVHTIYIRK